MTHSQRQSMSMPVLAPRADPMDTSPEKVSQETGQHNTETNTIEHREDKGMEDVAGNPTIKSQASSQSSKNAQTHFVQKLFAMLEDESNHTSIHWSDHEDSFLIHPGVDFAEVLAKYFKHKNPQSFVRQLNMYGFHKVNDVFQGSANGESSAWEFKHGEGQFRKGRRETLREVKRRPSKHTLDKRELGNRGNLPYYGLHSISNGLPGAAPTETVESRLALLEHRHFEQYAMWRQSEDARSQMAQKLEVLNDCVVKCQKMTTNITTMLMTVLPEHQNPLYQSIASLSTEIDDQLNLARSLEVTPIPIDRRQSTASSTWDSSGPMSPHGFDESRRASMVLRPIVHGAYPSRSAATSPARVGSISGAVAGNHWPHPHQHNPPVPTFWNNDHPPTTSGQEEQSPQLPGRRHTSADIRAEPGWRSNYSSSEYLPLPHTNHHNTGNHGSSTSPLGPTGSHNGPTWPPPSSTSPLPAPFPPQGQPRQQSQSEQQLRESLDRYQLDSRNPSTASDATITPGSTYASLNQYRNPSNTNTQRTTNGPPHSHFLGHDTSTLFHASTSNNHSSTHHQANQHQHQHQNQNNNNRRTSLGIGASLFNTDMWSKPTSHNHPSHLGPGSGSSTRRSSMAHILNPADTAERREEEEMAEAEADGEDLAPDQMVGKRRRLG